MNPLPIVASTLRGHRLVCGLFVLLVALAVALGVAVTAQERALRQGSARAADAFDLIVAAPGSQTDVLLSAVYLRPAAMELVPGDVLVRLLAEPRAVFAAPLAFGDSYRGAPVVGTTSAFVEHLSRGLAEGRPFAKVTEAVVGATSPAKIGDHLTLTHGMHAAEGEHDDHGAEDGDHAAEEHEHEAEGHDHEHEEATDDHAAAPVAEHDVAEGHVHGLELTVVGRLRPTGTPWDRAVVVPVEYTWTVHGLPTGHAAGDDRVGPPFAAGATPGVPAVIVKPDSVAAAYGLRNQYRDAATTAFFPAEALGELYAVLGDAARLMGALTLATQSLVVAATVVGVLVLLELYRRRFALLRALGAPRTFVFLTVWLFVTLLVAVGAILGVALGYGVAAAVSMVLMQSTGIAMQIAIGPSELRLAIGIVVVGAVLALVPAAVAYARPPVAALRQG